VATLKAKLARYEPTVAGQMDAARSETAKTRLAELEAQLVDTESNYVSAQAEVTRLSLMLDAAQFPESERQKHLDAKLEKLSGDAARYQADAAEKDRALQRITAQMAKLQEDFASVPALVDLRRDFRALAEKLTGQEAPDFNPSETTDSEMPKSPPAPHSESVAAGSLASGSGDNAPSDGNRPKASSGEAPASKEAGDDEQAPVQAQSKSANIANAAEALVSRIVASNRIKSKPEDETRSANTGPAQDSDRKTKATKQKKKDVA
jgi:hypothetical protein